MKPLNHLHCAPPPSVTSIVAPLVNGKAPGSTVNIPVRNNAGAVTEPEGLILALIFNDPSVTTTTSITLFFGCTPTTGASFNVNLALPANHVTRPLTVRA